MRTTIGLVATLMCIGCGPSATEQAEQQYNITSSMGLSEDRCAQAKKVEQAYLEANNPQEYLDWKIKATSDCMDATNGIERYSNGTIIEPDNMSAPDNLGS